MGTPVARWILLTWIWAAVPLLAFSWEADVWQQVGDAPVAGGSGQAIAATEEAIYVISQFRENTPPRFWRFTPGNPGFLRPLSTEGLPRGAFRNGTALTWDLDPGGFLYALLGARYPDQGDPNRRLFYRYDIAKDLWERFPDTPAAQGAGDALVYAEWEGKRLLYAFLGSRAHQTDIQGTMKRSAFAVYDIAGRAWEMLPFNPSWESSGTDGGASLVFDGFDRLYALQGAVDEKNPLGRFAVYSLATATWTDLADNSGSSTTACGMGAGASLAYLGEIFPEQSDYIYALGGSCVHGRPGTHFYRYHISSNEWEPLTDIPCPVGFYNGNRLFLFKAQLYYWQGSPPSAQYLCGGDDVFRYGAPGAD